MKRRMFYLLAATLLLSLCSCSTLGRTMGSIGRTFGNFTGQDAPVIH